MEYGGGIDSIQTPAEDPSWKPVKEDFLYLTPEQTDDYIIAKWNGENGRPGGSAFYRSQFGILTALIENTSDPSTMTDSRTAAQKYEYLGKSRFGYSLNISPISVSDRDHAEEEWTQAKIIKVPESEEPLTLAGWTGFPSHASFFAWCAKRRKPIYTALRKEYAPAAIYCGGLVALSEFKDMWMDAGTEGTDFAHETLLGQDYYHLWLDNGEGKSPTLLMIGPFFCNQYGLNSYEKYWNVARRIRELCNERLGSEDKWLKLSEFLPSGEYERLCENKA